MSALKSHFFYEYHYGWLCPDEFPDFLLVFQTPVCHSVHLMTSQKL